MEVFRLQGGVNVDVNDAINGLKRVQSEAKATQVDFGKSISNLGKSISNFGKTLTVGVSVPLVATGGYFIKASSDAQEMQSKFDTVFKTTSKQANKWSIEYAKSIGRSNSEIKSAISNQSDLMIGMGMTETTALDLSQKYTQLAYDLASFNNVNDDTAVEAMTKAMFGETEMAKQLGLNLNATTMEQSDYVKSLGKSWKEMNQAERAEAYYQEALKQSVNALGDAERTSDSYANQSKRLKGEITNLAEKMGGFLLPAATEVVKYITKLVENFTSADEKTQRFALVLMGLGIVIPPLIVVLGGLVMFIGGCIAAFTTISAAITAAGGVVALFTGALGGLGAAFGFIFGPIGAVIAAITAFIVAVVQAYNENETFRNKVNEVFSQIQSIISNVMAIVKDVIDIAWSTIKFIWDNGLKQILQLAGTILTSIVKIFTDKLSTATNFVRDAISLIKSIFDGDFSGAVNIVNRILDNVVKGFNDKMDSAKKKVSDAIEKIKGFFNFSWELPKLKMPHFKISGKFSLNPPSAPKFNVDWYSKGAIFTKPTLLGNIGVGDANNGMGNGPEAVLPIGHLRKYVREEVQGVIAKQDLTSSNNITISELLHIDNFTNNTDDDIEVIVDKIIMILRRQFAF